MSMFPWIHIGEAGDYVNDGNDHLIHFQSF